MAEVFISYSEKDIAFARKLAEALGRLNVEVWYDRRIRPRERWRDEIERELAAAQLVISLWSAESIRSKWVLYEAEEASREDRLLSVRIEPCPIPAPHSEEQALLLEEWTGDSEADAYLDLVEIAGERLDRSDLKDYAQFRKFKKNNPPKESRRPLRRYSFRDMRALCDRVRDEVCSFDPDVLFSFDSRGGLWAEMLFDSLTYQIPVIIGLRLGCLGPRHWPASGFESYTELQTARWCLYVPPVFEQLPKGTKVLFVDDYSKTGETCAVVQRHFTQALGFDPAHIKTLTLIKSPDTPPPPNGPAIFGESEDAESIDLFYMFQR